MWHNIVVDASQPASHNRPEYAFFVGIVRMPRIFVSLGAHFAAPFSSFSHFERARIFGSQNDSFGRIRLALQSCARSALENGLVRPKNVLFEEMFVFSALRLVACWPVDRQ